MKCQKRRVVNKSDYVELGEMMFPTTQGETETAKRGG